MSRETEPARGQLEESSSVSIAAQAKDLRMQPGHHLTAVKMLLTLTCSFNGVVSEPVKLGCGESACPECACAKAFSSVCSTTQQNTKSPEELFKRIRREKQTPDYKLHF